MVVRLGLSFARVLGSRLSGLGRLRRCSVASLADGGLAVRVSLMQNITLGSRKRSAFGKTARRCFSVVEVGKDSTLQYSFGYGAFLVKCCCSLRVAVSGIVRFCVAYVAYVVTPYWMGMLFNRGWACVLHVQVHFVSSCDLPRVIRQFWLHSAAYF